MDDLRGALICRDTGMRFPLDFAVWRSPATGGLLDLEWPSTFPIEEIQRRPATLWRYREALPIESDEHIVSLGEPLTPLLPHAIQGRRVLLKLDTVYASGSYKDRGAAILVSHCKRLGTERVVEDSSGNAGAAIAMYCARAGIACDIYVPESASLGKLVQVQASGARLVRVKGSRQATADAVWEAAQSAYYASHSWNPFFFHGTKTFAFEVVEQLGWKVPDAVVIPTGNGTLLLGAWIGFEELRQAGVIDRLPRLIAVQAAACAPLAWALAGEPPERLPLATIAEGIAIPKPVRGAQCLEAIRASQGAVVTVSEDQIVTSLLAAARAGLFIEPTSATGLAAISHVAPSLETVVVAVTGHGLKAAEKISHLVGNPAPPTVAC